MTLIPFDNTYVHLPEQFHARLDPTPVPRPQLLRFNDGLAAELGIDRAAISAEELAAIFAGNCLPEGAEPLAQAYAGHQFGGFVPQLGDGRAIVLGEVVDPQGQRRDIQLKGAGRTPFSRNGDGRAGLGPVLREYLMSEAMHALGIPTTRALAAVSTGETIFRETELPGAIITRVAASHLRIGTFQFFAARGDTDSLTKLVDYAVHRHVPEAERSENAALDLLRRVMDQQSTLVARWLGIGFIHGVMNTDNTTISGETIDYGPCAFMDRYDPATVFSSIDHYGRYAYGAQPQIIVWNVARLAEALMPVINKDADAALEAAEERLAEFAQQVQQASLETMATKLGLRQPADGDAELVQALLDLMQQERADFTNTFRALCTLVDDESASLPGLAAADPWLTTWRQRLRTEPLPNRQDFMRRQNPAFIPRNHLVEAALASAHDGDLAPFTELSEILSKPYEDQPAHPRFAEPAPQDAPPYETFCGT